VTIHWIEALNLRTITGRTFQADNCFHQAVARTQREIALSLLWATRVKKIRTDPADLGFPDLADRLNFYRFKPGPYSYTLRKRLDDAFSDVKVFWREGRGLWNNKLFLESLEKTEDFDDYTRLLCVIAACLLCLDRALVHCDRGHVWEAEDWLNCAHWLHVVQVAWSEKKAFPKLLAILERQNAKDRARARNLSKRWEKRNEACEKVLRDWEEVMRDWKKKDPPPFGGSAAKAGRYYAAWLAARRYNFKSRVVAGWISAHAKERGIKLNPPVA
jgi:hypothetical protein